MREFSKSEQRIVDLIIERDTAISIGLAKSPNGQNIKELGVLDILVHIAKDHEAYFNLKNNMLLTDIGLSVKKNQESPMDDSRLHAFRRDFFNAVYFIDYLHSEKLIYMVPKDLSASTESLESPRPFDAGNGIVSIIIDNNFKLLLESFYDKYLVPTESLIVLRKMEYKTPEEIRFNEAMKVSQQGVCYAKAALILAALVGAIQICTSIFEIKLNLLFRILENLP